MKFPIGNYYVEVKVHRYRINPTENILLRLRDTPESLRTQYQLQNETHFGKNQEDIKKNNDELEVKNYPKKKQPNFQQPNFTPPNCPSCQRNIWLDFDKGYYCQNCEYIINKQETSNHQIGKKKKFVDKIIIFQLDCHMLIKRLEKHFIQWLIPPTYQHEI